MPEIVQHVHVADAGLDLVVTLSDADGVVDLSQASALQIRLRKPDGTTAQHDAELVTDGTDGKLKITTTSSTFDRPGPWQVQAYASIGGDSKYSNVGTLRVYPNL